MMKPNGGSAFPMPGFVDGNGTITFPENGMSLRDWFAGIVLPIAINLIGVTGEKIEKEFGILQMTYLNDRHWPALCAKMAYEYADAMIAKRENDLIPDEADKEPRA